MEQILIQVEQGQEDFVLHLVLHQEEEQALNLV